MNVHKIRKIAVSISLTTWLFAGSGGWDQFKVNQERFGVKSTFNEEMYTTPLDRGLWTRELEEKAREIAREIEGENTGDLHVAEVILGSLFAQLDLYIFVVVI